MRILLINPPKHHEFALFVLDDYGIKARSNQVPLGLLYLHSYLKKDHDIKIIDMNAKEMTIESIKIAIVGFKPDIIGITCVIAKWLTVKALAKEIKKHTDIPIVVGGVNPSLYPWETLQDENIDYVVSGYGQEPFGKLCHTIEKNKNPNHVENVYNSYNCFEKRKGNFEFVNIDDFPMPDRSVLNIDDYQMPFFPVNPATSMITSAGCPYKCHFCACKNFQPVKIRKAENIINELKQIESIGIKSVLFQDELFTMSNERIRQICSGIMLNNINLKWSVRSRVNLINHEAICLMGNAGCFLVHLGIESGTNRILNRMKKGITKAQIIASVNTIKKAGLSCTASFMLGYPDESESEIMQTIEFAKNLGLNNVQFFLTSPEPNTELYEEVKSVKNLPNDIYSAFTLNPEKIDLKNNIASNIFTKKELDGFIKYAYSQTPNLYKVKGNKIE